VRLQRTPQDRELDEENKEIEFFSSKILTADSEFKRAPQIPKGNKVISLISSPGAFQYKRRFKLPVREVDLIKVDHSYDQKDVVDGDDTEPSKPLSQ
jgi:hypothetical protein